MKHIGWCLDQIQTVMAKIPREVFLQKDKDMAGEILDEVQGYADTLAKLIQNPKLEQYLHKLEKAPVEGVRLQAHEVEELLKDLEHMLYVVDLYIKELREIIAVRPEDWGKTADQIVLMIDQKFGGEMGELRKEFKIALYEEKELKELVDSEKHLEEFLK